MSQQKKRNQRSIVLNILILLFLAVAAISAVYLIQQLFVFPNQNTSVIQNVQKIYHQQQAISNDPTNSTSSVSQKKNTLADLRTRNTDIIGWVQYPETVINYPVVKESTDSSDFYLHHNYLKENSNHGSIFLPASTSPVSGKSLLLYGHNMKDGQMFHCIAELSLKQLKQQPIVYFDAGGGPQAYKIFSYLKTNTQPSQGTVFNYTSPSLKSSSDFLQFAYNLAIRSIYRFSVNVREGDQLLLLSTCSYEFSDFRTVLVARRVRTGETPVVNTTATIPSGKTLYPDCWYNSRGGAKPSWPAAYAEAAKDGKLPWPAT